jgi:predicted O-linked N-acetylglucosamine transferase (SPINDLY family)
MHDEYTNRARQAASRWIEVHGLDDQAIHQRVRDQKIDVLIDLAGHGELLKAIDRMYREPRSAEKLGLTGDGE